MRGKARMQAAVILVVLLATWLSPVGHTAPVRGGTLVVGANSECLKLDPHLTLEISCRTMVGRHIYSGLVKFNEKMEVVPDLATKWEVSQDGKVLTFTLRPGVVFHNGEPLAAEDVKASIERIRDPKTASPLRTSFASVEAVDIVNPQAVRLRLSVPDAAIMSNLAEPQTAILPRSVLRAQGDMNNVVIGTGPFRLLSRRKDVNTVLVRNDRYFIRGVPLLERIEFRIITDDTARSVALRTGRLHFMDRVQESTAAVLNKIPGIVIARGPSLNWRSAIPNLTRRPWNDVRVRQAFAIGIDRKEIVDAVLGGNGEALTGGPIPSNLWAALPQPCYARSDPARARALLAQAGFPNGFAASLMSFGEITLLSDTAVALREQALRFGVDLRLELLELGIVQSRRARGDFDLVVSGFSAADPDPWLARVFRTGGTGNFNKFSDPEIDALLDRARAISDQAQRQTLYLQVQRRLCESAPVFWLYTGYEQFAMRPEVKGYVFRANNEHNFEAVWLQQ